MAGDEPYYRPSLALAHHLGFGAHADACAPGILALLEPLRAAGGVVLELGCGSGHLTRHLVDAGHRVVATDASPAMLALAAAAVPEAELRRLDLRSDPLPAADAIVSVGHVLSYLPDESAIEHALLRATQALRPGGVLALDLCDLRWGAVRVRQPPAVHVKDEWVLLIRFSVPHPARFVRDMTIFVREASGRWERDDERHDNVLVATSGLPVLLGRHGVEVQVGTSFGGEELPEGLVTVIGWRTS